MPGSKQKPGLARPSWAVVTGVLVVVIYLLALPFVARTWRATGDEPHYLLAAHSLVTDFDFDLANNYNRLDYLNFYFSRDIDRQIRTDRAGRQILNHQLGLPVLIAPAYAWGGRLGVLLFQVVLGGVLAALMFKLSVVVSRHESASLLATLFVTLTPPFFAYNYLVYPELAAALLVTLVLYLAMARNRPTPLEAAAAVGSLLVLPWLNRRFIPLALALALLAFWAWRDPLARGLRRLSRPGLAGVIAVVVSVGVLAWFNSQLNAAPRPDITAPVNPGMFWLRLGRSIGWLVDQQRGLFSFAPIYIFALWGLPPLFHASVRLRNRAWFAAIPAGVALAVTAVAGGYWIPWEVGPRFLVVGLPGLAAILALAWKQYARYKIWRGLVLAAFAISLANSWVIIKAPELPYKSSFPIFYARRMGIPFPDLLPDMAGYARLPAAEAGLPANGSNPPLWFVPAGRSRPVVQSGPLYRLPFGHYRLNWPVRVEPGLPPQTGLLHISVKSLGGGSIFNRTITAADLPRDGSFGQITLSFFNPNPDRWRTPVVFHAVSTGRSSIWGRDVIFAPVPFYAWFLPYFYLGVLSIAAILSWVRIRRANPSLPTARLPVVPSVAGWSALLVLLLAGGGYLFFRHNPAVQSYDAAGLYHLTGQAVADSAARDGRAWLVNPQTDPPQKATYGPFDFFDEGRYHIAFRVKLPDAVGVDEPLARLQVQGADGDILFTQPLRRDHFTTPGLYHDFVLAVYNPRRQALSFEMAYLGVAPLAIDEITVTRLTD